MATDIKMPDDACMLRPVRFIGDEELRYYDPVVFVGENPHCTCGMYYRRCKVFGGVAQNKEDAFGICDVLNSDFDIVGDFYLNKKGLKYLYKALNTPVDKTQAGDLL